MNLLSLSYSLLVGSLATCQPGTPTAETPSFVHAPNLMRVPLGGNSWVMGSTARITSTGLSNWSDPATTVDTYVRFEKPGTLNLSVRLGVPDGQSRIRVTVLGQSKEVNVTNNALTDYAVGQWAVAKPGYVKISLQGIRKTGRVYADVTDLGISGEAVTEQTRFVLTNEGNFFYWGRRGPSVHLRYPIPDGVNAEWFYNEVTVPVGNDVVGSYYMANGFGEGYFGMQVNSATERRILFSVWSPFQTDDPGKIPDDQKIRLVRKGPDVVTNDFGNEGSGGQSFLRYRWVAGQTYQFLLHGQPTAGGYTTYTAYFKPADAVAWQLIASFKRPKTTTYLTSLYSFLENFDPETGNVQREVEFSNGWIRTVGSEWRELTDTQFTADNTARKAYRVDYAGGLNANGRLFLRNCGFFDTYSTIGTPFRRPAKGVPPVIDPSTLPE